MIFRSTYAAEGLMVGLQVRKWRNQADVLPRDVFRYSEHAKAKFFCRPYAALLCLKRETFQLLSVSAIHNFSAGPVLRGDHVFREIYENFAHG